MLHAPMIPSRLWTGLQLLLMMQGSDDEEAGDDEVIIPIDLDLMKDDPSKAGVVDPPPEAPPEELPPSAEATATAAKPTKPKPDVADAGVDAAVDASADAEADASADASADAEADASADAAVDAGLDAAADAGADAEPQAGIPDGGALPIDPADAGPDAGPIAALDAGADGGPDAGLVASSSDAGAPTVKEPLSQAGGPSQLAGKDPNVQILIAGDRIRSHALGRGFGNILRSIPEWQDFFQNTNIDPIKDLDHMLLAGPRFKGDSSQVVAVMDYNRPDKDIRDAVDGIVTRANGTWIKDAPVPAARAKAQKADRIFALVPEKNLLVILPGKEEGQLKKLKALKAFSKSSPVAIVISMVTPSRPFKGILPIPESFKWLRMGVTPTKEGATVSLEAADASPEEARKNAQLLTAAVDLVRRIENPIPFGPKTIEAFNKVEFVADGNLVRAEVKLSMAQLTAIMALAERSFQGRGQQGGKK